jgi:hypothetical protein
MRLIAFALFAVALVFSGSASAQGPGSFARYTSFNGGVIRLDANYVASDRCQAAVSAHRGAPAGQRVGQNIIPVTIVIGPNPRGCGNTRVVRRIMTVGGPSNTELVQIFFVNPSGRILKVERVSIATF